MLCHLLIKQSLVASLCESARGPCIRWDSVFVDRLGFTGAFPFDYNFFFFSYFRSFIFGAPVRGFVLSF